MSGLYLKTKALCKKYEIPNFITRYIPDVELKNNLEVSTMLFLISYFLSTEGESWYKIKTYNKLAPTIENMDENIEDIYKAGKLTEIKGIGKTTLKLIEEFLETKKCGYLEELMR